MLTYIIGNMDKMDGYLLYTFVLLKYISQIQGNVCISWSLNKDHLRIVCRTYDLHLPVIFCNPSREEVAYCPAPNSSTQCHASEKLDNITQGITSGDTVYVVKGALNNHQVNGEWSCYHGFVLDKASVEVIVPKRIGLNVRLEITVGGPKYVQVGQHISMFCTSNTVFKDSAVSFHVNNQFYTKIYKNGSGCFSSLGSSNCQSGMCQCLSDGRSFILQYVAELSSGVLQFRCSMDSKVFGTLTDCLFVTVVDISGPFITTDKDFPLHAGSVVELTCKAISRGHILEMCMNCLDTDVQTHRRNNNTYVAKLSKRVKSSDNGTLCTCKLSSVITRSSSIKLHIIRAPILETVNMVFCNNTDSVILSCQISGEMSKFDFYPWEHRFNGTYIRSLLGKVTGNVSFLTIDSCSYEDIGEYICEARNKDSQKIFHQNNSTSVIVKGPPVVVDKTVTMGTTITLSVKFLSVQKPNKPKWYHKNRLLPNSTRFYQKTSNDIIVIRMYGEIVPYTGYIATLTVVKEDIGRFKFLLLLRNNHGTAETTFELNNPGNGSNVFNIRLFSLVFLAVFLFLISVILSTILVYRQRRDSKRKSESRAIYFAAAGQINNVNIYDVTTSPYEEINDGELVPEHSNDLINPSAMNNTDNYEEEGVRQYLELE